MRRRVLITTVIVPILLWLLLPVGSPAREHRSTASKIEQTQRRIAERKRRERLLSTDVARYGRQIRSLQNDISGLQRRQTVAQTRLDRERATLSRTQGQLRAERFRLARLRVRLAESRSALAQRLVMLYKADEPDLVTAVLEADGFAELLERMEFLTRLSRQDSRILSRVRVAKRDATETAGRLGTLERRQRRAAAAILEQRNELAAVRAALVDRRQRFQAARGVRAARLARVSANRRDDERALAALERASARVAAKLRAVQQPGSLPAGPIRTGSGTLIWPVNGPITSPFGPRWGRLHAGIDIGAPEGTPIRAADSGSVTLAGNEGAYGLYTCIGHGTGLSTCYAHQSRIDVRAGQNVTKGSVIGAVGNTGRSFGAHLHFETRVGGAPQNPMAFL